MHLLSFLLIPLTTLTTLALADCAVMTASEPELASPIDFKNQAASICKTLGGQLGKPCEQTLAATLRQVCHGIAANKVGGSLSQTIYSVRKGDDCGLRKGEMACKEVSWAGW